MPATRCSCGFESQPDEDLTDHLLTVFAPPGSTGTDGQTHEEHAALTCSCGFAAPSPAELDNHFLTSFTPATNLAPDGRAHQPVEHNAVNLGRLR
jgi:hypothetical protein